MTTFYLVRYGSSYTLGDVNWGREAIIHLTQRGKAEARSLELSFSNIGLSAIYSSPIWSARETAELIASAAKLEVRQVPAFDVDLGRCHERSIETLTSDTQPKPFFPEHTDDSFFLTDLFLDLQTRAIGEIERLTDRYTNGRVAIVCNGEAIKAIVGYVANTPIDLLAKIEISPCSVSIIDRDQHEMRLLRLNVRNNVF